MKLIQGLNNHSKSFKLKINPLEISLASVVVGELFNERSLTFFGMALYQASYVDKIIPKYENAK